MDVINKLDHEYDWIFQLMQQNFELKRRITGLLMYIDNLKTEIVKETKEDEPIPLFLDEIFSDTNLLK